MIYNHRVLTNKEKTTLKGLIQAFKYHDRLDLLIELAVYDTADVLTRKFNKKKKKEIKTQSIPEELKFCDSDHCEYNGYNT